MANDELACVWGDETEGILLAERNTKGLVRSQNHATLHVNVVRLVRCRYYFHTGFSKLIGFSVLILFIMIKAPNNLITPQNHKGIFH